MTPFARMEVIPKEQPTRILAHRVRRPPLRRRLRRQAGLVDLLSIETEHLWRGSDHFGSRPKVGDSDDVDVLRSSEKGGKRGAKDGGVVLSVEDGGVGGVSLELGQEEGWGDGEEVEDKDVLRA
jgi:hypothetical protein